MYQENSLQDFQNWLNSGFLKRNPDGWMPPSLDLWYSTIDKNHVKIREILKNKIVQKSYQLTSIQKPIDINNEIVVKHIDRLEALDPKLLKNLGLTREDFQYPVLATGTHNARKLSKVLSSYFKDLHYSNYNTLAEVDKIISNLGEIWAKHKTNSCNLEITISTNAKAFTLLGHYGPDKDSCFRQGSTSPYDKYIFAQSKDTFVISVSKPNEKKKHKRENVARALGWFDNGFHVRNYYFAPGFQEGDFLSLLEMCFSELLNTKVVMNENCALLSNAEYNGWTFYQNNYGNWSFGIDPEESYLELNLNGILCFECEKCHKKYKNKNYFKEVDETHVCEYCYSHANICEISSKRTFSQLEEIIDDEGNSLFIHPSLIKNYVKCECCNKHTSKLSSVGNEKVCNSCLAVDFSYCDIGEHFVRDSEIIDIGDISCCKNHKKNILASEMIEEMLAEIE